MKSALLRRRRGKGRGGGQSKVTAQQEESSAEQGPVPMQTTAIRPEQSLALVEIFLNGAIASVLFKRQLIHHGSPAYSTRCVSDLSDSTGPVTYKSLLKPNTLAGSEGNQSQIFKVLIKGRSEKADKILTLLEGGVFPALHRGYLEAVQLSICADSSRPSEVMECYTFTFTYNPAPGRSHRAVSSVTVSPGPQPAFFVGDACQSFSAAMKGLLKVVEPLPLLPRCRSLGLNLFYTDDCPATYEPKGFESCIDDVIRFPGGVELTKNSEKTPGLVVGTYRTGVVVSHVKPLYVDLDYLKVIPEAMDYSTKCSRLGEYKINLTPPLAKPSQRATPSEIMASPAAPSTQTRDDIRTKQALQQMQRSSSKPQDLMPTQSLLQSDDTDGDDSDVPEQPSNNSIQSDTRREEFRQSMLVPTKMAELIVHVKAVQQRCPANDQLFDQAHLNEFKISRKEDIDVVKCECTNNTATDPMLECEICGTLQHPRCYGWIGIAKDRRPIDHFCYSCLLLPKEKALNDWMPVLVKCRNILNYLKEQVVSVRVDDTGLLEVSRFTGDPKDLMTSPIMQTLLQNQLIKKNRANRIMETNYDLGWAEYVSPLASIYHLYQNYNAAEVNLRSVYSQAVLSLESQYAGFALDVIRTHDSYGDEVIRFGYYPRLAAIQSRKRSASMSQDSRQGSSIFADAGEGGPSKMPRRSGPRKMSRSELICCDASSTDKETFVQSGDEAETETETEQAVLVESGSETEENDEDEDEDEDDLYN